jgi:hypothetical protein
MVGKWVFIILKIVEISIGMVKMKLFYVRDAINPSILYRVEEIITEENKKEILFFYDDPAGMFTTRIYKDHPKSPFKK